MKKKQMPPPAMKRPPMGKPESSPVMADIPLHQVVSGDTWQSVASEYGVDVAALMQANDADAAPGDPVTGYRDLVIPEAAAAPEAPMMMDEGMGGPAAPAAPMEVEEPMEEMAEGYVEEEEEATPPPVKKKASFVPTGKVKSAMDLNAAIAGTPAADSAEWTPAEAKKFVAWVDAAVAGGIELKEPFATKVSKLRARSKATRL